MRVGKVMDGTFVPNRLSDQTSLEITYDLLSALSRANLALGKLDGLSTFLPNTESVIRLFELKDVLSARSLEQEEVSPLDYFEAILTGSNTEGESLVDQIRKEVQVLHGFYQNPEDQLTRGNIKELAHAIYGDLPLENMGYRKENAPEEENILTGKFLSRYTPVAGNDLTALIENLFTFLSGDTGHPAAIKAGLIYAQWNFIQPYRCRNMSLIRILIMRWLLQNRILMKPVLALSPYFEDHRVEFQFRLLDMIQSDEWNEWITYVILGLEESALESVKINTRIIEMASYLPENITAISGNEKTAINLLKLLYNQPLLHIQHAAAKLHVAFGTANSLLHQFEELGIVSEITGQSRNKRFLFRDYFRLFFPDAV